MKLSPDTVVAACLIKIHILFSFSAAIHEKAFISFVLFSVIHMMLSCYLFKRGRPEPWDSNVSSIL